MALDSLIDRIVNASTFIENYEKLLLHSVRSQFQNLSFDESDTNINWEYLISCASLLSKSSNGKILDILDIKTSYAEVTDSLTYGYMLTMRPDRKNEKGAYARPFLFVFLPYVF